MRDTGWGEAKTQAEGETGSMQGARCGTQSRDSRIVPWAKGRCQTAEPPRDLLFFKNILFIYERERERQRPRQREKQAPCREPDVGLNPRSPGSGPGPKGGAKPPRDPLFHYLN